MKKPIAISLFCGAGGCSLGFKNAGFDIIYASDFDPIAIQTYRKNFPQTLAEVVDIRELNFSFLLQRLNLEVGELDILIGGPPCQGFSTAGTRFWDDPRNQLLKEYVRCLKELKPKWFLMENVEGLLTSKDGEYLFEAAKAFTDLGYKIRIDKVYAHEYGVPQRRKRVFIIGNNLGINFELPKPSSPATGRIFKNSQFSLGDALINLPNPSSQDGQLVNYELKSTNKLFEYYKTETDKISDHFSPLINGIQLKRISSLKQGQTMKDLPEDLQHNSFKKRAFRRVKDGTPTEKRGGAPSGLKRLYINQPCLTITSAATREFIHPTEDRTLTLRECARIQTFPDYFEFTGSQSQKAAQIGNAIPPILAQIFANHISMDYGFKRIESDSIGRLYGYTLTKAGAISPALEKTQKKLDQLKNEYFVTQMKLF